jgi:hypothetical protein
VVFCAATANPAPVGASPPQRKYTGNIRLTTVKYLGVFLEGSSPLLVSS